MKIQTLLKWSIRKTKAVLYNLNYLMKPVQLDENQFTLCEIVPSATFTVKNNGQIKDLKPFLLKKPKLCNPIKQADKSSTFLFDSKFDNTAQLDKILQKLNVELKPYPLHLTYENFSYSEIFSRILPSDAMVSSYSRIGSLIHLNLRPIQHPYKYVIGQVLKDKLVNVETVLNKQADISNEFRNFESEILAGNPNTQVTVHENGCVFQFDFAKVYWNPRLSTEHERITKFLTPQDVLLDPCAGVGPFVIPACKRVGCFHVFANDLNPDCVTALQQNVKLNKINPQTIHITCLDVCDFIRHVIAPLYLSLCLTSNSDGDQLIKLNHTKDNSINYNNIPNSIDEIIQNIVNDNKDWFKEIGDFHVPINLPSTTLSILSTFRNLFTKTNACSKSKNDTVSKEENQYNLNGKNGPNHRLIIHAYFFLRDDSEDPRIPAKQTFIEFLNKDCPDPSTQIRLEDIEILETVSVRKVAPFKHMMRISFVVPLSYLIAEYSPPITE